MNHSPRTSRFALASLLALAPHAAPARETPRAPAPQQTNAAESKQTLKKKRDAKTRETRDATAQATREAKEKATRERQRQAVAALLEAAETVRPAEELYESIRLRAEIADALWPHDEQSARPMLRRAWETATAPGAAERVEGFGTSEDPREDARDAITSARSLVIKTALKRDPRLAGIFMREFERELSTETNAAPETAPADKRGPRELSRAGWQRLSIARQLMEEGEHARAAETAAPLIGEGPTPPLLDFISQLRARAASEADALYLRLLERARADASAGANDVLLISTPVVSPDLRVSLGPDGSANLNPVNHRSDEERRASASLPVSVRRAFFNAAAAILLRPRATAGAEQHGDEAAQLYFATARLLPFFEREAPSRAPALHARLSMLATEIEAGRRDSLAARANVLSLSSRNSSDPLASLLNAVSEATDARARDWQRFLLVSVAAGRKLWERARGVAAEIEDAETQRNARRVIAISQVMDVSRAFEDEDVDTSERAADFVRAADVPPEARAAGLAQAAELAARRGKRARAGELLGEATGYAEQAERAGDQRVTALALVTLSAARANDARVWELLPSLVSAANEADNGLPYAVLGFDFKFEHLSQSVAFSTPQPPLDLREVFATTARLDLSRALTEARAFTDEVARANMLFAAARAALEKMGKARARAARVGFAFAPD